MKNLLIFPLLFGLLFCSCTESKKRINESVIEHPEESPTVEPEVPRVTFYQYDDSAALPDAILELYVPLGNQTFRPGKVPFEFNVKNFTLEQKAGENPKLYMILNGGDPVGYFSPIFQRQLTEGTYRVVAFLTDGEGLALKSFGNYVDRDFMVGESRPFPYSAEPYLALNYPRNGQKLEENGELIVDFLVLGGEMKLDGLKVQILVNEYSYEIDHMAPVRVAHLPKGDYQVQVRLLRSDGKELDGPFSSVSKTVYVR